VTSEASRGCADEPVDRLVESFTRDQLVEVVLESAARHEDVARAVRLAAAWQTTTLASCVGKSTGRFARGGFSTTGGAWIGRGQHARL
jgi:hypothetical protein